MRDVVVFGFGWEGCRAEDSVDAWGAGSGEYGGGSGRWGGCGTRGRGGFVAGSGRDRVRHFSMKPGEGGFRGMVVCTVGR